MTTGLNVFSISWEKKKLEKEINVFRNFTYFPHILWEKNGLFWKDFKNKTDF